MKKQNLFSAFSLVDAAYVEEAARATGDARRRTGRSLALVASVCLCAVLTVWLGLSNRGPVIIEENGFYIEDGVLLSYSGDATEIVLPESVTAVADYAFVSVSKPAAVQTVTLGNGVKTVGRNAFAGLSELRELILSDNTAFVTREDAIFTADGSMLVDYIGTATSYTLPSEVRYIGAHAFQGSNLTEIVFNDGLEYIGYNAFAGCDLIAIYLPESIVRVDEGAFAGCTYAVDGYIPTHIDMDDSSFEHVPFYLTLLAGHMSPLEEIRRGLVTPSEAAAKTDNDYLKTQIETILAYYRTGTFPSDAELRLHHIVDAELPKEAVLPESFSMEDIEYRDNGFGGMGIRDLQLCLPLGENCTLVMEAYLYGGGMDILDWSEARWRIEQVMFAVEVAEPDYAPWSVTQDASSAITFYNTETGVTVRTPILQDYSTEYALLFSPNGNRCIVEYKRPSFWAFFVLALDGEKFQSSQHIYVDYLGRYFGQYEAGSLSWADNDTIEGINEHGAFTWNIYETYPVQTEGE